MDCPVCGTRNEAGAGFCYHCGSALRPSGTPQPNTGHTVDLGRSGANAPADAPARRDVFAEPPPGSYMPASPPPSPSAARVYEVQGSSVATRPDAYGGQSYGTAQTSNLALISMILGIVSWVIIPFIGAIGAVITGHMAKREINSSGGRLSGGGMATAGLILGYLNLILAILGFLAFCLLAAVAGS